jgi:hypothetical protein
MVSFLAALFADVGFIKALLWHVEKEKGRCGLPSMIASSLMETVVIHPMTHSIVFGAIFLYHIA